MKPNNKSPKPRQAFNHSLMEAKKVYPIVEIAKKLDLKIIKGNRINCVNPSHMDNDHSMLLDSNNNTFKCFVCGHTGDNIKLVRLVLNITERKALQFIKGQIDYPTWYKREYSSEESIPVLTKPGQKGMAAEAKRQRPEETKEPKESFKREETIAEKVPQEKEKVQPPPELKADDNKKKEAELPFWEAQKIYKSFTDLLAPIYRLSIGIDYFRNRDIGSKTLDELGVRFIDNSERIQKILTKKYTITKLEHSGLFIKDQDKENTYKFKFEMHKVIFPFFRDNHIIDLYARLLTQQEDAFISLFSKSKIPYHYNGLNKAKEGGRLFICSNIIDTITLYDRGYPNCIGFFPEGYLTERWIETLSKYKPVFVLGNGEESSKLVDLIAKPLKKKGLKLKSMDIHKITSLRDPKDIDKTIGGLQLS